MLVWLSNVPSARLEDVICATWPEEGTRMETIVQASQLSWSRSSMPVHPGPTNFDKDSGLIRFQHKQEDKDAGLRAYMPDIMGDTMVATKMSSRFSDAYYAEWIVLNVPFRHLEDLFFDGLARIPDNYKGMALAVHHAP
eukprot:3683066-Amphidinium_carterae.1